VPALGAGEDAVDGGEAGEGVAAGTVGGDRAGVVKANDREENGGRSRSQKGQLNFPRGDHAPLALPVWFEATICATETWEAPAHGVGEGGRRETQCITLCVE